MARHTVVIPTYNEQENIEMLIENIVGLGLGLQVIIVDDVMTSGATANAIAGLLKQGQAAKVSVAVVARGEGCS